MATPYYYPGINPEASGAGRFRLQILDITEEGSVTSSFKFSIQINPTSISGKYSLTGSIKIDSRSYSTTATNVQANTGEWTTLWEKEAYAMSKESVAVEITENIVASVRSSYTTRVEGTAENHTAQIPTDKVVPVRLEDSYGGYGYDYEIRTEYTYYNYETHWYTTKSTLAKTSFTYNIENTTGIDLNKKISTYADSGVIEAVVLDKDLMAIGMIDVYESFIWTERFAEAGDFEIYTRVGAISSELVKVGNYLTLYDSDVLMMIEAIETTTDPEEGDHIKVVGRSAEALLERRIVWSRIDLNGSLQNGIKTILADNVIVPEDSRRRIPFIGFKQSFDDRITTLTIDGQYTGNNIYDLITDICDYYKIGFKMTYKSDERHLYFELYKGTDRSFSQTKNSYMVFSREFDNMFNSEYQEDSSEYKNVVIVFGKEATSIASDVDASVNSGYFTVVTGSTGATGVDRREVLCTDSKSASSDEDSLPTSEIKIAGEEDSSEEDDDSLPDNEYAEKLRTNGDKKLNDCKYIKKFSSEADTSGAIAYGRDYCLGDIIEFVSDYGVESRARITEIIRSQDENGYKIYPTFLCIDDETEHTSGTVSK